MRARGMTHHQHLVGLPRQRLCDPVGEFTDPRLQLGRVGAAPARRIGIIMHQVIGKEGAILGAEPAQQVDARRQPQHKTDQRDPWQAGQPAQPPTQPDQQQCRQQLRQQHPHRVKRGDHRPLPQPHQPPEHARGDIGPGGARQLRIGGRDRVRHAAAHDIGPDQHLHIRRDRLPLLFGADMPAIRALGGLGLQRDGIARDPRLLGAFLAIELAIPAGMNRVVAGDIEHPASAHLTCGWNTAHGSTSLTRA